MNILFIESSLDPSRGGIARVTYTLANYFKRQGINCYFAFYCADFNDISVSRKLKFDENSPYADFKAQLINFIKEKEIDVIINQDLNFPRYTQLYSYVREKFHVKVTTCLHNVPDFYKYWALGWKFKVHELLYKLRKGYDSQSEPYRKIYKSVDRFVVLSKFYIPIIKNKYGIKDLSKIAYIPNPIPFDMSRYDSLPIKKKQFLIIARLDDHQKNLKSALRIWKQFELRNDEYKLIIAGYGKDEKMLLDYAKELHINRMSFIGKTTDAISLYKESQFLIMTSRYEGFPMTLIEAQQNGCIPIAFNSFAAIQDIIVDNQNGIIVKKGKEQLFVNKMVEICLDEKRQKDMASKAINSVKSFSVSTIGKQWIKLVNTI